MESSQRSTTNAGVGGTDNPKNPSFWSTEQSTLRRHSDDAPAALRRHSGTGTEAVGTKRHLERAPKSLGRNGRNTMSCSLRVVDVGAAAAVKRNRLDGLNISDTAFNVVRRHSGKHSVSLSLEPPFSNSRPLSLGHSLPLNVRAASLSTMDGAVVHLDGEPKIWEGSRMQGCLEWFTTSSMMLEYPMVEIHDGQSGYKTLQHYVSKHDANWFRGQELDWVNGDYALKFRIESLLCSSDDSLIKPVTRILVGVALIIFMITLVSRDTPDWLKKLNFSGVNFPPWILACVVIVFTRMRKRTKDFLKKRGW
ncbi:uncharacterized protein HKW66_Vig0147320 [Vigna angularis]|uniref:Uncharacterized protein n=1 Tax=Phaseolus angularis TaxID=3914 RepID=A0A8T0JVD6_PHAAN|nr:uncharacterized protein HKW66_Vig0147320 [Vigna angularis]